jgi:hypothetical protein
LWQVAARRSLRTLGTDLQQKAIKAIVYVGCERKPDFAGQSFASNPNNFDTTSATAPAAWPFRRDPPRFVMDVRSRPLQSPIINELRSSF